MWVLIFWLNEIISNELGPLQSDRLDPPQNNISSLLNGESQSQDTENHCYPWNKLNVRSNNSDVSLFLNDERKLFQCRHLQYSCRSWVLTEDSKHILLWKMYGGGGTELKFDRFHEVRISAAKFNKRTRKLIIYFDAWIIERFVWVSTKTQTSFN